MKKILVFFDGSCEPTNPGGTIGVGVDIMEAEGFLIYNANTKDVKTICSSSRRIYQISERYPPSDSIFDKKLTTNNIAEHMALNKGLWWAMAKVAQHPEAYDEIVCFGDSQIAIRQMRGEYNISARGAYYTFAKSNVRLLQEIIEVCPVSFYWIPRELNKTADKLSNPVA